MQPVRRGPGLRQGLEDPLESGQFELPEKARGNDRRRGGGIEDHRQVRSGLELSLAKPNHHFGRKIH